MHGTQPRDQQNTVKWRDRHETMEESCASKPSASAERRLTWRCAWQADANEASACVEAHPAAWKCNAEPRFSPRKPGGRLLLPSLIFPLPDFAIPMR
eukprot:6213187-Pleurochrysis_carterae.AAC.3